MVAREVLMGRERNPRRRRRCHCGRRGRRGVGMLIVDQGRARFIEKYALHSSLSDLVSFL